MIELVAKPGLSIKAIVYRNHRKGRTVTLMDGTIVEELTADQRKATFPVSCPAYLEVSPDCFVSKTGFYFIPTGDVAIVYGAEANPIVPNVTR